MPTNLAIDDDLIEKAKKLGGHRTKRAAVNEALLEYVRMKKRLRLLDLVGTIDFDPKWDYKAARRKR